MSYPAIPYPAFLYTRADVFVRLLAGPIVIIIWIETIFDTLNAKAAVFAVENVFAQHGIRFPVRVSDTITDASGRIFSGQTVEALRS